MTSALCNWILSGTQCKLRRGVGLWVDKRSDRSSLWESQLRNTGLGHMPWDRNNACHLAQATKPTPP